MNEAIGVNARGSRSRSSPMRRSASVVVAASSERASTPSVPLARMFQRPTGPRRQRDPSTSTSVAWPTNGRSTAKATNGTSITSRRATSRQRRRDGQRRHEHQQAYSPKAQNASRGWPPPRARTAARHELDCGGSGARRCRPCRYSPWRDCRSSGPRGSRPGRRATGRRRARNVAPGANRAGRPAEGDRTPMIPGQAGARTSSSTPPPRSRPAGCRRWRAGLLGRRSPRRWPPCSGRRAAAGQGLTKNARPRATMQATRRRRARPPGPCHPPTRVGRPGAGGSPTPVDEIGTHGSTALTVMPVISASPMPIRRCTRPSAATPSAEATLPRPRGRTRRRTRSRRAPPTGRRPQPKRPPTDRRGGRAAPSGQPEDRGAAHAADHGHVDTLRPRPRARRRRTAAPEPPAPRIRRGPQVGPTRIAARPRPAGARWSRRYHREVEHLHREDEGRHQAGHRRLLVLHHLAGAPDADRQARPPPPPCC